MLKSRILIALDKTVFLLGKGKIMGNKLLALLAIGAISLAVFLACDNNRTPQETPEPPTPPVTCDYEGCACENCGGRDCTCGQEPPTEQTGEIEFGSDGDATVNAYMNDADFENAKAMIAEALNGIYNMDDDEHDEDWMGGVFRMFLNITPWTINVENDPEFNWSTVPWNPNIRINATALREQDVLRDVFINAILGFWGEGPAVGHVADDSVLMAQLDEATMRQIEMAVRAQVDREMSVGAGVSVTKKS